MNIIEKIDNYLNEAIEYCDIVFLDKTQDFEDFSGSGGKGREGFFDSGDKEMFDFLMQWEDMNYSDCRKTKPWGAKDKIYKKGDYIMSYNSSLGYAGLVKKFRT
jgi:hypothetical protein